MKRKATWIAVSVLVIVGLLMGSFGCDTTPEPVSTPTPTVAPPVKPIVLKSVGSIGDTFPVMVQLVRTMDLIEERSDGRIEFEYHPAASLYNLKEASEALADGLADVGNVKGGYFVDKLGVAAAIANFPFNYTFEGFAAHVRDSGGFYDWISPYYADRMNWKLLSYPQLPGIDIISTKPIRKLEDFDGILMRSTPGPAADAFTLLGAEPVFMPSGEIYEGMLRGTIDATNSSTSVTMSNKYYEPGKYWINCGYTVAGIELAMNLDAWNELPADLQKIVEEAFLEGEEMFFEEQPAIYKSDLEKMEAAGVEIITIESSELDRWRAAVAPLYEQYAQEYGAEWAEYEKIREVMLK